MRRLFPRGFTFQKPAVLIRAGLLLLVLTACTDPEPRTELENANTVAHGYNELQGPKGRTTIAVSDYNRDSPGLANIRRPARSLVRTDVDTALLFDTWTTDPEGPHADFVFSGTSIFIVDYDGNGDMPYTLESRTLRVFYNDFIQEGTLLSVDKDSLRIQWKEAAEVTAYTRWRQ